MKLKSTISTENERSSTNPRVCAVSLRNVAKHVARCVDYEFEDIICEIDDVDLIVSNAKSKLRLRVGHSIVHRTSHHLLPQFSSVNPGFQPVKLEKDYDVFLAVCMNAWDLYHINAIKNWKQRCKTSVCWFDEMWADTLPDIKGLLALLSQFDYVFISCSSTLKALQERIPSTCIFIPAGIDAIQFCPYPNPPPRAIDVLNIGRRSQVTHDALLDMASTNEIFYLYDTIASISMFPNVPQQHRRLLASMAKRSKYFVVNIAKINHDHETNGQHEVGFRFYEGAAAGTVMIGVPPDVDTFREHFNWPDSVIPMDFDKPDVADFLRNLNEDPKRLEKIRKNGVIESLKRHDWVYRWKTILKTIGLEPTPAMAERERRLLDLVATIEKTPSV